MLLEKNGGDDGTRTGGLCRDVSQRMYWTKVLLDTQERARFERRLAQFVRTNVTAQSWIHKRHNLPTFERQAHDQSKDYEVVTVEIASLAPRSISKLAKA